MTENDIIRGKWIVFVFVWVLIHKFFLNFYSNNRNEFKKIRSITFHCTHEYHVKIEHANYMQLVYKYIYVDWTERIKNCLLDNDHCKFKQQSNLLLRRVLKSFPPSFAFVLLCPVQLIIFKRHLLLHYLK